MIFHRQQAGDPSDRLRFMDFYLAAPAPRMILELSASSVKGIADGDVEIFMGRMLARFMRFGEVFIRFVAGLSFFRHYTFWFSINNQFAAGNR